MAREDFVRLVSSRSVGKALTLYQIFQKHNLPLDDVVSLLRCEIDPTPKMLKAIAKELETSEIELRDSLKRTGV